MRFHPSKEQLAIQETLRRALADAFPRERLGAIVDGTASIDQPSWDVLMALGLGGLALPEEHGGSGLGLVDLALALEVAGAAAATGPLIEHLLVGLAIAATDDADAKVRWLPSLAAGRQVATVAFGGAWVPDTWNVTLEEGKASGVVDYVVGADAAQLFLVGTVGAGLALVEAGAGVSIEPLPSSDPTRRGARVTFARAPATLLCAPGDARAWRAFDAALVLLAAEAWGGADECVERSVAYAKERRQFGQPIGRFQGLKHQLAHMALETEPARALVWYAAYAHDAQLPEAPRAAAIAKAHVADRYVSVMRAAIAAHGGIGYTWEHGLHVWFRRALFDRAYLGGPTTHRARAAAMAGW
ncbi:acyl-CoA/acyl-ACP dehydrogenase [Phenylobacterium sp. LjRoot219]|uniref:acyl-CoA dehydrogenase family protein n=1 Tax=Phenylobacterium sp. LjRoot219 TaxID=3342283 RepID=UPI003ED12FFE